MKELAGVARVKGIEPSYAAWEAAVLPLNYTRDVGILSDDIEKRKMHETAFSLNHDCRFGV